jgi:hypothetical protein
MNLKRIFACGFVGIVSGLGLPALADAAASDRPTTAPIGNTPQVLQADARLHLDFGPERMVLHGGLQPSILCTSRGTLIVQGQIAQKSLPSTRMAYPSALRTVISRDGGASWTTFPLKPGTNGLNLEGGAIQLRDGTILALDTYVTPGPADGQGVGQLYTSHDDWQTLDGPTDVPFDLPDADFYASSDDGGHPYTAERVHRRFVELPDGSLLATLYGCLKGDHAPCPYQPKMMQTRMLVVKSTDRGMHWKMISNLSVDADVGTEGLGEAALCRISRGPHAGRLICLMRTGRNLYQAVSDDGGNTWTKPAELIIAGRDVNRTELWVDYFRRFKDFKGKLLDENNLLQLRGAVVDPDIIELRSGIVVACFGVRVPQKLCWQHPEHPWNGNYVAVSLDHGDTWSHVVQITSGVLTTHYMAVAETPTDNQLYLTYDLGGWSRGMRRDIVGRSVTITRIGAP